MCGIAGQWNPSGVQVDVDRLEIMTRALVHRGPDDEGFLLQPGVGLGHRRLSIIDLATGHQPLCNEDEKVWVVFNGEIFNYVELRKDLEKRSHRFRTHSDTETLVHLYEEYGLDFVQHLNGQFAIALWDATLRRLVLARDRVGIRPLFYARLRDGSVIFASEIKALFAHGHLDPELDAQAIGQIADLWVPIPPRTPFVGVEELEPGHILVLEPGRVTKRQYWRHQFPRVNEYEDRPLSYWQDGLRGLLEDSVRLQLRSDVPVATYLSGGLDSSILTALVKRHHINDLTTFSVAFADGRFDERAFQQTMVEHLGTDHRQVEVNDASIGHDFSDVIWFAERPIMRTAPAPLLALSGLVRDSGIKVVLTGEGADEVFGGYNIFKEDKARRFWARQPNSTWRPALLSRLYGYIQRDSRGQAFWQQFFGKDLTATSDPYYSHRRRWENASYVRRHFNSDFQAAMRDSQTAISELDRYLDPDRAKWHPLAQAQYLEMALFMSCYLLNSQGDRMMMGNSIEGRVPFLDHRLIEFAARIPPKFKLRGLDEKWILKRTFADLLPGSISRRPKHPYRAPIAACFSGSNSTLTSELLQPDSLRRTGIVNHSALAKLFVKAGRVGLSEREEMAIATTASLQLLHHHFIDRDWKAFADSCRRPAVESRSFLPA